MTSGQSKKVTVKALVAAPVERVWQLWNTPGDIIKWNTASPDWHTISAENDLRPGGAIRSRMEAKDGSFGFDFEGVYDEVRTHEFLSYSLADGRRVEITFTAEGNATAVTETFDAEGENPIEMQRAGWQAILDNFKKYAENTK